jgi:hypothetical protein
MAGKNISTLKELVKLARIIILDLHRQATKKHNETSLTVDKLVEHLYSVIEALDKKDYTAYFGLMADIIDLTMAGLVDRLEQEAMPGNSGNPEKCNLQQD